MSCHRLIGDLRYSSSFHRDVRTHLENDFEKQTFWRSTVQTQDEREIHKPILASIDSSHFGYIGNSRTCKEQFRMALQRGNVFLSLPLESRRSDFNSYLVFDSIGNLDRNVFFSQVHWREAQGLLLDVCSSCCDDRFDYRFVRSVVFELVVFELEEREYNFTWITQMNSRMVEISFIVFSLVPEEIKSLENREYQPSNTNTGTWEVLHVSVLLYCLFTTSRTFQSIAWNLQTIWSLRMHQVSSLWRWVMPL